MGKRQSFVGAIAAVLATVSVGCGALQPDFERLFRGSTFEARRAPAVVGTQPPVIVVPGLLGSRLVAAGTGEEAWPGGVREILFGRYVGLALPMTSQSLQPTRSDLQPAGITEMALGRDFYGRLLNTLVEYGGYRRVEPGTPPADPAERRVYVFDYDWRQDNVITARLFADFIEAIRTDYADPRLKVDVIAHSMGGLMARYFLRFGTEDVLDDNRLRVTWAGAYRINKMILLGTPSMGAVSAIEAMVRGERVGMSRIPPEVVATMPSIYQLFPHRIVPWLYTVDGRSLNRDQFDVDMWRRFQWNVFDPKVRARVLEGHGEDYLEGLERHFERYAERARRFSWSLTVCPGYDEVAGGCPAQIQEPPVRLVVFGGNCTLTPARVVVEETASGSVARFDPGAIARKVDDLDYRRLMYQPGDGRVTKPSLLGRDALSPYTPRHGYSYFPLAHSFLLCEGHSQLTGNVHFQDNLLDTLLTRALPGELHKDHSFSRTTHVR